MNGVTGRKRIPAGYTLLIPVSSRTAEGGPSLQNAVFRALPAEASAIHRVRRGETLYTIASEYGLTQQQLRVWNRLRGDQLSPGMRLRVSEASSALRGSRHTTGSRAKAHRGPAARRTKAGKTRRSVASH